MSSIFYLAEKKVKKSSFETRIAGVAEFQSQVLLKVILVEWVQIELLKKEALSMIKCIIIKTENC